MKKFSALLLTLSLIIITGCKSTKVEYVIVLPPKPVREELPAPTNISDCAEIINYYNSLVKSWEAWASTVEKTLEKLSPSISKNTD